MISSTNNNISFTSNPLINATSFIEERVLLNKALLDGARDASIVCHTNNKNEREERIRRFCIAWSAAFLTPFVTLPLTNRLAMKHIAKLSSGYFSNENNLIKLSNKYLKDANLTKIGIEELSKKENLGEFLQKNQDYEKVRKKILNAKNAVLSFDFLFTSTTLGCAGFVNRYKTRKKTGRDGFSAEFNMADKDLVEKRAEAFKKSEKLRDSLFIISVLSLASLPLILKKGMNSQGKLSNFIKKYADKFDYNDGIFMKRLPFLMMTIVADLGLILSSRNQTEVKDNAVRLSATQAAFFGGDIIIGSTLAGLSDKLFKTELLDKNCKKTLVNKLIPPVKSIKELQGKNKATATGLFWVNMASLFAILGIGIPKMMNKIIKKDIQQDVSRNNLNNILKYPKVFESFKTTNTQIVC